MHIGDIIRDRHGSWMLWRVVGIFGPEPTYVRAVKLCDSKTYHYAGEDALLRASEYQIERDPLGFVRRTLGAYAAFVDPHRRWALRLTTERNHP